MDAPTPHRLLVARRRRDRGYGETVFAVGLVRALAGFPLTVAPLSALVGSGRADTPWTGIPIVDLVEEAGVPDEAACCVMLRAADGHYEELPLDALRDGSLACGTNGHDLPRGHGYPMRALVPGHWGEINVERLDEVGIRRTEAEGYWEGRGWHGTGPVNTVAKIEATRTADGTVTVGGRAYAGTRGASAVEASTDWTEADRSERLPDAVSADADPDAIGGAAVRIPPEPPGSPRPEGLLIRKIVLVT